MHKCKMHDFIICEDGKITRIVNAEYRDLSLACYKENEDGRFFVRNIYYGTYGYYVNFPGERLPYSIEREGLHDWCECSELGIHAQSRNLCDEEKEMILELHPDFRYVMQKYRCDTSNVVSILSVWKKNPKIELLLANGMERIAFSKMFYKLNEKKQKEIIRLCMKDERFKGIPLNYILLMQKNKISYEELHEWLNFRGKFYRAGNISYHQFKYLMRSGNDNYESIQLYKDYLKMLKNQGEHDLKDPYWLYPSDLRVRHNKVLEEINIAAELKRFEEEKIKANKLKYFYKKAKKYSGFNSEIEGYSIFIPGTVADVKKQSEKLNQCLIRCNYIEKMARGNILLVFIRKNDEPIATAEILPGKKLGQFYGDEHAKNIKPDENVTRVFNGWLKTLKMEKVI